MAVQINNQLPIAKQSTVISRYPFNWLLQKIVNSDIDIFGYFQMHQIFHSFHCWKCRILAFFFFFWLLTVDFFFFFFFLLLTVGFFFFSFFFFFFLLLTVDCISLFLKLNREAETYPEQEIESDKEITGARGTFSFSHFKVLLRISYPICGAITGTESEKNIRKTRQYNVDPLKPHFYIVKLGFTGVYIILLISAQKHRLWVLFRTASVRRF